MKVHNNNDTNTASSQSCHEAELSMSAMKPLLIGAVQKGA